MTPPVDTPSSQEHLCDLAARLDEALADGEADFSVDMDGSGVIGSELLRHAEAMILLRRMWPRQKTLSPSQVPPVSEPADMPTLIGTPEATAPIQAEITLAGYRIIGERGRGGMGVVYEAHDSKLDRRVAVKFVQTQRHQTRFLVEAQAVARLQHPHIIQIFELGECPGGVFLALEYLPGGSLAQKIRHRQLPFREAVALVETLARAVHHAHEQGVIHRDLKPANVMFTEDGQPKIVDFGLAKRLEAAGGETRHGEILGTPEYMAPEQARGHGLTAGPAADVYSLGVILYEMIAGHVPLQSDDLVSMLVLVCTEEPVPPRQFRPDLPRDLETICLKCLEKEPAKRYVSAADLADDLRRYLEGHPITARPVSRLERAWRWCRRNPLVAGSLAAALFILLAATVVSTSLAFWAWEEKNRADLRTKEVQESKRALELSKQDVEANLKLAQDAVERCFLIAKEDPQFQGEQARAIRRKLLEAALPFFRAFQQQRGNDPALLAVQADNLHRIAYILNEIGDKKEALQLYQDSRRLWEELLHTQPANLIYQYSLANTLANLGHILHDMRRQADARTAYEQARAQWEKLVAAHPGQSYFQYGLGNILTKLGVLHYDLGEFAEALACHGAAEKQWRGLTAGPNASASYRLQLANTLMNRALVLSDLGRYTEALPVLLEARTIQEQLTTEAPQVSQYQWMLGLTWDRLAIVHSKTNQPTATAIAYTQSQRLHRRLTDLHPHILEYRIALARSLTNSGVQHYLRREFEAAVENFTEAEQHHKLLAASRPEVLDYQMEQARNWASLGLVRHDQKRWEEAITAYRQAKTVQERIVTAHPLVISYGTTYAANCCNLGQVLLKQEKPAEALREFDQAMAMLTKVLARVPRHTQGRQFQANTLRSRAVAFENLKRFSDAAADWLRAADLEIGPLRHALRATGAVQLARAGKQADALREAERLAQEPDLPASVLVDLARLHALLFAQNAPASPNRSQRLDQAIDCLNQAQQKGYADWNQLPNDPDLAPLQDQPSFKKLFGK